MDKQELERALPQLVAKEREESTNLGVQSHSMFRVWNVYSKCYVNTYSDDSVFVLNGTGRLCAATPTGLKELSQEEYIVEPCTGYRDHNGELIFAGDIVESAYRHGNGSWGPEYFVIEWQQSRSGYNIPYKAVVAVGTIHTGFREKKTKDSDFIGNWQLGVVI